MNIYLVEMDNLELPIDNYKWVEKAFKSYRGASEWLIEQGYEAYCVTEGDKIDIKFYWQADKVRENSIFNILSEQGARIVEMELTDR